MSSRKLSELLRRQVELARKGKSSLEDLCLAGKISMEKGLTDISLESRIATFSEMVKRVVELVKFLERSLIALWNYYTAGGEEGPIDESRELAITEAEKCEPMSANQAVRERLQESPPLEMQQEDEAGIPEAMTNGVFSYLESHSETSLSQIAEDLHLPVSKVKNILVELERHGRIGLS